MVEWWTLRRGQELLDQGLLDKRNDFCRATYLRNHMASVVLGRSAILQAGDGGKKRLHNQQDTILPQRRAGLVLRSSFACGKSRMHVISPPLSSIIKIVPVMPLNAYPFPSMATELRRYPILYGQDRHVLLSMMGNR